MGRWMKLKLVIVISIMMLISCTATQIKSFTNDLLLYLAIRTSPDHAKIYYRIASSTPSVKNTNLSYLGKSPYAKTKSFHIKGMTKDNVHLVSLVFEIEKEGHYEKVERVNLAGVYNDMEISLKFYLKLKEDSAEIKSPPPGPPGKVLSSDGKHEDYVLITWDKLENVQGYYLYRDTNKNGTYKHKLTITSESSFEDKTAVPKVKYYYRVSAYNENGESELSYPDEGFRKASKDEEEKESEKSSSSGSSIPDIKGNLPSSVPNIVPIPAIIPSGSKDKDKKQKDKKKSDKNKNTSKNKKSKSKTDKKDSN